MVWSNSGLDVSLWCDVIVANYFKSGLGSVLAEVRFDDTLVHSCVARSHRGNTQFRVYKTNDELFENILIKKLNPQKLFYNLIQTYETKVFIDG